MDREQRIQDVIENISRLQRAISPIAWEKAGISRAQAGLLYMLHSRETTSMKQIAEHLAVSNSAVSQLMEPLLTKGLVTREVDPNDRRSAVIRLTERGLKSIKHLKQLKMLGLRTALGNLSDKDLVMLGRLHAKMAVGLKSKE